MSKIVVWLLAVALCGAGCFGPITAPQTAQPLESSVSEYTIARSEGFGMLPAIPHTPATDGTTITLNTAMPTIPEKITVIRLRRGTPNPTELRNIAAAVGIPTEIVSANPSGAALDLSWTDADGYRWTYSTADRALTFVLEKQPKSPLTVSLLPSNDDIAKIANVFLLTKGINAETYRAALVEPDWNNWWLRAKDAGLCMDLSSLASVRAIGASDAFIAPGPPAIPETNTTQCVAAEFPSTAVVRYRAFVDQRDVFVGDTEYVPGIELAVSIPQNKVTHGRIALFSQADRSDYTSITAAEALEQLRSGGVTGASGNITLNFLSISLYRVDEDAQGTRTSYLIPALVGIGTRTKSDQSIEEARIVVPLLKQ